MLNLEGTLRNANPKYYLRILTVPFILAGSTFKISLMGPRYLALNLVPLLAFLYIGYRMAGSTPSEFNMETFDSISLAIMSFAIGSIVTSISIMIVQSEITLFSFLLAITVLVLLDINLAVWEMKDED